MPLRPLSERREQYRNMTTEEILISMPADELQMNVDRGGIGAIKELTRREKKDHLIRKIIPDNDIDIGV